MSDMSDSARKTIHEGISEAREGEMAEAVLVNAIVIAEWMDPSGDRWITRIATTDGGDRTPPMWTCQGLLHYGLCGDWDDEDEDD